MKEKEIFESEFTRDLAFIRENADTPRYNHYAFVIPNFTPETPVDVLELSVRAENSLKRCGVNNFGQLNECNLRKIRGCGTNTIKEINTKLMSYFYDKMSPELRKKFWKDTLEATKEAHKANPTLYKE